MIEVRTASCKQKAKLLVLLLGAVSYRIAVRNTETDSTQQLRSSLSTIEVSSLEAGTFYTMQVFSIGEEQENSVGSTVVLRQTSKSYCK